MVDELQELMPSMQPKAADMKVPTTCMPHGKDAASTNGVSKRCECAEQEHTVEPTRGTRCGAFGGAADASRGDTKSDQCSATDTAASSDRHTCEGTGDGTEAGGGHARGDACGAVDAGELAVTTAAADGTGDGSGRSVDTIASFLSVSCAKALYRRAIAYRHTGSLDEALADLRLAAEIMASQAAGSSASSAGGTPHRDASTISGSSGAGSLREAARGNGGKGEGHGSHATAPVTGPTTTAIAATATPVDPDIAREMRLVKRKLRAADRRTRRMAALMVGGGGGKEAAGKEPGWSGTAPADGAGASVTPQTLATGGARDEQAPVGGDGDAGDDDDGGSDDDDGASVASDMTGLSLVTEGEGDGEGDEGVGVMGMDDHDGQGQGGGQWEGEGADSDAGGDGVSGSATNSVTGIGLGRGIGTGVSSGSGSGGFVPTSRLLRL